jgi:hypothetical protein
MWAVYNPLYGIHAGFRQAFSEYQLLTGQFLLIDGCEYHDDDEYIRQNVLLACRPCTVAELRTLGPQYLTPWKRVREASDFNDTGQSGRFTALAAH